MILSEEYLLQVVSIIIAFEAMFRANDTFRLQGLSLSFQLSITVPLTQYE